MTASALVIVTDVMRQGKPVTGVAFDSVGRYAHGALLRERFIPRLLSADRSEYLEEGLDSPDPFRVHALVMRNEKPGGHGDRAGGGFALVPPLHLLTYFGEMGATNGA
jgi:hypothetical protein